jgi:phosphatidylinositol-3-phosphatase
VRRVQDFSDRFPARLGVGVPTLVVALVLVALASAYAAIGAPSHHGRSSRAPASASVRRTDEADARAARRGTYKLPRIRHVFFIALENENYENTFGDPSADPYLASTLPAEGALVENYYGTGHESNDNYISLISGQPPNPENQSDCQYFTEFPASEINSEGVEQGVGCVYPESVQNIGTQLTAHGLKWKGYMQDMGNDPNREAAACGHPKLGAEDETQDAVEGDGYATRHDPFVYFNSVISNQSYCDAHVVAMGSPTGQMPAAALKGETGLATDLKKASTTPNLSFITPNLCNDGHDYPCTNQASGLSAVADIDSFLETWVPMITSSPAFKKDGLLEITFDESDGPQSDSTSCCEEKAGPSSPFPGITGAGGGRVGAVLISPFIKPGTVTTTDYNHYSTLASWEEIFHLARLADAASVPSTFGADVFTDAR